MLSIEIPKNSNNSSKNTVRKCCNGQTMGVKEKSVCSSSSPTSSSREKKNRKTEDKTWLKSVPSCSPLLSSNLCFCAELPFKDGILIWPSRVMPWKSCSGFGSCSGMRHQLLQTLQGYTSSTGSWIQLNQIFSLSFG